MPEATKNLIRNAILDQWDKIRRERVGAALLSPFGETLRAWQDIEEESRVLAPEIARAEGTVAVQTGNDPSVPAILLACWRSGRAVVLYDPEFQGERRGELEAALGVTTMITRQQNGRLDFSFLTNEGNSEPGICFYKVTAGTDAGVRAIGFTAEQLKADCDQISETMGIGSQDVNYGLVAFSHSYGFSSLLTPVLCRGTALVVASDSLPWAMESGMRLTNATVAPLVPAMFRVLLSVGALPSSLRLCVSAGVTLDPILASNFHARFGLKVHSFYGTSDCGGICYDASEEVEGESGFVGKPVSGVSVELLHPEVAHLRTLQEKISGQGAWASRPCGEGLFDASDGVQTGETPVPPVRSNFRRCANPEALEGSRIKVRSGAVATGGFTDPCDLLVQGPRGFLIVGKESDIINVAGKKVHPSEIEAVLLNLPGVADAVVYGTADLHRGEEVCSLIISPEAIEATTVRRYCANHLPSWQIPRRIRFLPSFPVGLEGKKNQRIFARQSQ